MDSETPAAAYILKLAAASANLSDTAFDSDEANERITEMDLVSGSLTPVPGGQTVILGLSPVRCPPDQLYFFAMTAWNTEGVSSPVSNIVAGLPTCTTGAAPVQSFSGGLALAAVLLVYLRSAIIFQ